MPADESPSAKATARSASASASTSGARVKREAAPHASPRERRRAQIRRSSRRRAPRPSRATRRSRSTRTTCATSTSMLDDARGESNAVVICIMDTSGSMDTMKKYLARSFFFLLYQFICDPLRNVEIVFIAHHTEANEVTEEEFFHKGESGGTLISSGYQKALEIITERYHPSLWNVYAFHCSDGDNFDSDNPAALKAAEELCRDLQPVRLRRDQAAGLALLRVLDAERVPPARGAELPVRADRAQGRHLAASRRSCRANAPRREVEAGHVPACQRALCGGFLCLDPGPGRGFATPRGRALEWPARPRPSRRGGGGFGHRSACIRVQSSGATRPAPPETRTFTTERSRNGWANSARLGSNGTGGSVRRHPFGEWSKMLYQNYICGHCDEPAETSKATANKQRRGGSRRPTRSRWPSSWTSVGIQRIDMA